MVSSDVMTQAGISPEEDISDTESGKIDEEIQRELEDQDLDVFEDFLKNFDIDDLSSDQDNDEEDQDWSLDYPIKVIIEPGGFSWSETPVFCTKFILNKNC